MGLRRVLGQRVGLGFAQPQRPECAGRVRSAAGPGGARPGREPALGGQDNGQASGQASGTARTASVARGGADGLCALRVDGVGTGGVGGSVLVSRYVGT